MSELRDALGTPHAPAAGEPRIVSLVPSLTELLCDLGLAANLVGRSGFCIHPREAVRRIPKMGGTKDADIERIRAATGLRYLARCGRLPDGLAGKKGLTKRMPLRWMAFLAGLFYVGAACAQQALPIIDAHSQFDQHVGLDEIMHWLDRAGVSRVILSDRSTGMVDRGEELLGLAAKHPDRITPAIRSKPPAYSKMREPEFHRYLARQAEHPGYGALAEIILTHAAMRNAYFSLGEDVEILPGAHQTRTAAGLARRKGWPLLLHIEFTYIGQRKAVFMEALERLLAQNRDLPVGLMHMGQLEPEEAERLVKSNPNVFFMLSWANPVAVGRAARNDPRRGWIDMFQEGELKPRWRELMLVFPDRFVLAIDNVFKPQWSDLYVRQIAVWRKALSALPEPVAHAVAHGNAERLWKLPPVAPAQ